MSIPRSYGGATNATVGPDGSFYIAGPMTAVAIDPTGHLRSGWPVRTPIDQPVHAPVVAPDGSLFVMNDTVIVDIDQAGAIKPGWPLESPAGFRGPFVSPGGSAVLIASSPAGTHELIGLDVTSATPIAWSAPIPGSLSDEPVFVGDDTIVLPLVLDPGQPKSGESLVAFRTDTKADQLWSVARGQGMSASPSGDLAVWSYVGPKAGPASMVAQTRVTLVGSTGTVLTGWPYLFQGPLSAPAFGPDGTVYFVTGSGRSGVTGSLVALDRTGQPVPGWPVKLPKGCDGLSAVARIDDPDAPEPPTVSADGRIIVPCVSTSGSSVWAYHIDGGHAPGWPYNVPPGATFGAAGGGVPGGGAPGGPILGPLVGPDGIVYLMVNGPAGTSIIGVGADGGAAQNWTVVLPTNEVAESWTPVPSGGLLIQTIDTGTRQLIVTRITSSGVLLH